jgi:ATP-dependent RNA helicase DeaD
MTQKSLEVPLPEAFAALGLRSSLLRGLAAAEFTEPSDIQQMLIPRALAGVDILGQARTGTGKTAAYGLPILQKVEEGQEFQAIVLVPTRELAVQVDAEINRLAKFTSPRSCPIYGGQRISQQVHELKHGPEILVGTPGRVMDLLQRRLIHFRNIRFIVLDEVDRMLDIGFRDDIRQILGQVRGVASGGTPAQTIFCSATISEEIERLARTYMHEPVEKLIAPGADERPTVANIEQWYFSVQQHDKYQLLKRLLERENPDLAIVFCRTKHGAERLAKHLHSDGIVCREIHGNLRQNQRDQVMKNFRTGKFDVLVATDLASRGIDVQAITHIINYDIPEDTEGYIHRVGRTARMGAPGKAFTFVEPHQGDELTRVESLINMLIPQAQLEGFAPSRSAPPRAEPVEAAQEAGTAVAPVGAAAASVPDQRPAQPLPVRTLGSKQPLSRRHRRR